MSTCPRCRSTDCQSIRLDNIPFDQVAGGALAARQAGQPAHAISALLVWGGIELLNYLRHCWRCRYCGYRF